MGIVDETIDLYEKRLKRLRDSGKEDTSRYIFTDCMKLYFERIRDARANNKPLAMTGLLFPTELLLAMDIVPFAAEQIVIQQLTQNRYMEYFEIGEGYGFTKEGCSPQIATVGLAVKGMLPEPDFLLTSAPAPCDSSTSMFDTLYTIYKKPIYFINLPYRCDEMAVEQLKLEFQDMVNWVTEVTGHKLNMDRLKFMLKNAAIAHDKYVKFHEFRKNVPCPFRSREAFSSFGVRMGLEGDPVTLKFFDTQYKEAKEKVEKGFGGLQGREKYRLVTNGAFPFWDMAIFDYMEEKYGAVVVVDIHNMIKLQPIEDPEPDPMGTLAKKFIYSNMAIRTLTGSYVPIAEELADSAYEYKCNAGIYFLNFGCKHGCGRSRVVIDAIKRKCSFPMLMLDVDAGNPKVVSDSQMKFKIDQYFTMMEKQEMLEKVAS